MDPMNMQGAAQSEAIQKMLATASPDYIAYLKSVGALPPDFVAAAPVAAAPAMAPAGMVPPAPAMSMVPQQPVANPMQAELMRYFGL